MKSIFKNSRQKALKMDQLKKYLLYAIGELLLIVFGILIAVQINENVKQGKEGELKCIYLNELLHTFNYDIKDVEDNIEGFNKWNPKILSILGAIENKQLAGMDSLHYKLGTVGNYIYFGQRSKTKIEELKYSTINFIENRILKNKILLYQNDKIMFIRQMETQYGLLGEDIRQYYTKNFMGFNYEEAIPLDIEALEKDKVYFSLVRQRYRMNMNLKFHYERLLKEQKEIKALIIKEIEKDCED